MQPGRRNDSIADARFAARSRKDTNPQLERVERQGRPPGRCGRLIDRHQPGLVLLQETTAALDSLPDKVGGHYVREPMTPRDHGPAAWSPIAFRATTVSLPWGTRLDLPIPLFRLIGNRLALIIRQGPLQLANVHLDHGQRANRRQLRHLMQHGPFDMVVGDFNALGPVTLPGFTDVGPRRATHWAHGVVPLRLDRCLVRGLVCTAVVALEFGRSDHRPILVDLVPGRPGPP